MTKEQKNVNGVTGKEMKEVIKELDEYLEKPIPTVGKSVEFMAECIVKAHEALQKDDEISEEGQEIIGRLKGEEAEEITNEEKGTFSRIVKELSKTMNISDPLDVKTADLETLREEIISLGKEIDPKQDEKEVFSKEALTMIEKLGVEIEWSKTKPASKKKKEGPKEAKEGPKEASETGPGVIASILEFVTAAKKPISIDGILTKLSGRFPDRNPDAMIKTIRVQLPKRMSKEKGVNIVKSEKGYIIQ